MSSSQLARISNIFEIDLALQKCQVVDHTRATSNAGTAYCRKTPLIEMSLVVNISLEMYETTLFHEWAHIVDHLIYNGRGHGGSWRHVMVRLDQKPERCHKVSMAAVMPDRYTVVKCPKCPRTYNFSNRRLAQARRGAKYRCSSCSTPLTV